MPLSGPSMPLGKTVDADRLGKPRREPGRDHKLVGEHSAKCKRGKHEDWQHGLVGCAVGLTEATHCDCKAHWVEVVPDTRFGQ